MTMKEQAYRLLRSTPSCIKRAGVVVLLAFLLLTACTSSRKSLATERDYQQAGQAERLSMRQAVFALLDSLTASYQFQADSLVVDIPAPFASRHGVEDSPAPFASHHGVEDREVDSLLRADGRPSVAGGTTKVVVYGLRSTAQLTHTQACSTASASLDTASLHRTAHERASEHYSAERQPQPPSPVRHLTFPLLALALLLALAVLCYRIYALQR